MKFSYLIHRKEPPRLEEFEVKNEDSIQGKLDSDTYISRLKFHNAHDLEKFLKRTYAGKIGVEFEHTLTFEERQWLYDRFEELSSHRLSETQKKNILTLVTDCEVTRFIFFYFRQSIISCIKNSKLSRDIPEKELNLYLFA